MKKSRYTDEQIAFALMTRISREALAIDVDQGIKGEQVVEVMTRISSIRGAPRTIRVDNVLCREALAGLSQQVSIRRPGSTLDAV